ncbi:MAG: type II toxin-antitoxin system VapC family toxin [Actinomycetota bacterium]|jgi:predicted nucleic acid-binding protein
MTVVLDTSALIALHISGPGRTITNDALKSDPHWCASAIALTEALAAIDRLTEEPILRRDLEDAIRHTWDYIAVVPLDQRCLDDASHLIREQPLHISDALHLSAAQRLPQPVSFVTFDPAQIPVALSLGFEVVSS